LKVRDTPRKNRKKKFHSLDRTACNSEGRVENASKKNQSTRACVFLLSTVRDSGEFVFAPQPRTKVSHAGETRPLRKKGRDIGKKEPRIRRGHARFKGGRLGLAWGWLKVLWAANAKGLQLGEKRYHGRKTPKKDRQ